MEQDLSQVCFNPVLDLTQKWSLHEVIASYVSKYYGSKTDKRAISAQILEDHGAPDINNFVVPQINQAISWLPPKVQNAKNVPEGDKHVANVQQMLMSASHPLLKFWNKIISQEDFEFEAEELLKDIQQSSFQGISTHRRRRFKCCLAKVFSSLADSDSDEGLSPFLSGSNLAEIITSQTEIN